MRTPPRWFERELKILDDKLYIIWNEDYQHWEIWKELPVIRNGKKVTLKSIRGAFETLNDKAMEELRQRAYVCRSLEVPDKPERYLKMIKDQAKEIREKEKERARDMIAEGFVKIHNLGRKTMFT